MICYRNGRVAKACRGIAYVLIGAMIWLQPGLVWALEYPRGDLNGDGSLDRKDATALGDYLLGQGTDAFSRTDGDFNKDESCDPAEAVSILKYNGDWEEMVFVINRTSTYLPRPIPPTTSPTAFQTPQS